MRCSEYAKLLAENATKDKIKSDGKDERYFGGNCTAAHATLSHALGATCEHCWLEFKKFTVDKSKAHLWPGPYIISALFVFVVISVFLNIFMVDNCKPDEEDDGEDPADEWRSSGNLKMISLVLTGLVGLLGLLLVIFGVAAVLLSGNYCSCCYE